MAAEIIKSWNYFIESLGDCKEAWEDMKEEMIGLNIELLPIEAQRVMRFTSITRATTFERMLMQFMQHWQRSGGLNEMLIILPKPKPKPKEEKVE